MERYIISIHWIIDGNDKGTISKSIGINEIEYFNKLKKACHSRLLILSNPQNTLAGNERYLVSKDLEGDENGLVPYMDSECEETIDGKNSYTITLIKDGYGFDDLVDLTDLNETQAGTCYKSKKSWEEAGLDEVIYVPEVELIDNLFLDGHILFAEDIKKLVSNTTKREMLDTVEDIFYGVESDNTLFEIAKNIFNNLEWACFETECLEIEDGEFNP